MKGGPRRGQEVKKFLQGGRFTGTPDCRLNPPVLTLVDPWWTRREAAGLDAARRSTLAPAPARMHRTRPEESVLATDLAALDRSPQPAVLLAGQSSGLIIR